MKYTIVSRENDEKLVEAERVGGDWKFSGKCGEVSLAATDVRSSVEGLEVALGSVRGEVVVATALGSMSFLVSRGAVDDSAAAGAAANKPLKSSMPGKILSIACKVGDRVAVGQTVLVIEAMKMENEIRSSGAGVIEKIAVAPGQKVEAGELLLVLAKEAAK